MVSPRREGRRHSDDGRRNERREGDGDRSRTRRDRGRRDGGDNDQGVSCPICWQYVKCQHQLEQHQQTNARCLSYQGKGPGRITCRGCRKKITAQAWAVEQHAWSCRQSRNDPYRVVGNQEVDGVIGRGHHGPSGSAPVRLRSATIYGIILPID